MKQAVDIIDALLQLPFTIIQRTNIPRFQPTRDTVKVEGMLQDKHIISTAGEEKMSSPTLQMPHAALHSSLVAETWFA
jgi:hypothetical protein